MNISQAKAEAKNEALSYLYTKGVALLDRRGKYNARKAFDLFNRVKKISPQYEQIDEKITEASQLGKSTVLIQFSNNTDVLLPSTFENQIKNVSLRLLNRQWIKFETYKNPNKAYDYDVIIHVDEIHIGPEQVSIHEFIEEKQIKDGWTYTLDEKGNVIKDSLGNTIKIPTYRTIKAFLKQSHQIKKGFIKGSFDFFNQETKQRVHRKLFNEEIIFENKALEYTGDRNALRQETQRRLNPLRPFPSNQKMITEHISAIKNKLETTIIAHIGLFK